MGSTRFNARRGGSFSELEDIDIDAICEQQPQDRDDCIKLMAQAPPSFSKWLAEALVKEHATCKIQLFLRYRLRLQQFSKASTECTASTVSSAGSLPVPKELNEGHLQYEAMLWHDFSLGSVGFASCITTGYLAEGNVSLPGMWNLRGCDFLISINDRSTKRSVVPFDAVMQILDSGVRPAVLRSRKPASYELQSLTTAIVNDGAHRHAADSRAAGAVSELRHLARIRRPAWDQLEA